jgi:hypothetical protein
MRTDLYDPCTPTINQGHLGMSLAQFPQEFQPKDTKTEFRNINWEEKIDKLSALVNSIDQSLVFGVNSDEQMAFLKNYFGNTAVTVSYSYDESFYDTMLTWVVTRHIAQQDNGIIEITQCDKTLRDDNVDLIEYYKQSFEEQNLIPKTLTGFGDCDIPIKDFFNIEKFFQHLSNLDNNAPTIKAITYYNEWYAYNKI